MQRTKLERTDGFVVRDVPAPVAAGVVRSAPKILVDGAGWLARSLTYRFASFGLAVSGASAGVNARPDHRDEAVAAFAEEVGDQVAAGSLLLEPGRGVGDEAFAALRAADPRPAGWWAARASLTAAGVVAAAGTVGGGLDGRRVTIEGIDAAGPELGAALVRGVAAAGAAVVALTDARTGVVAPDGLDLEAAVALLTDQGGAGLDALGSSVEPEAALRASSDVLLAGSRAGAVGFELATELDVGAVVPWGAIPVTAKALAQFRRDDVVVLPDFVTTAGASLVAAGPWGDAAWPAADDPTAAAHVAATIGAVLDEVRDDPDGPVLGACRRAESVLATRLGELPFGRPLA